MTPKEPLFSESAHENALRGRSTPSDFAPVTLVPQARAVALERGIDRALRGIGDELHPLGQPCQNASRVADRALGTECIVEARIMEDGE